MDGNKTQSKVLSIYESPPCYVLHTLILPNSGLKQCWIFVQRFKVAYVSTLSSCILFCKAIHRSVWLLFLMKSKKKKQQMTSRSHSGLINCLFHGECANYDQISHISHTAYSQRSNTRRKKKMTSKQREGLIINAVLIYFCMCVCLCVSECVCSEICLCVCDKRLKRF